MKKIILFLAAALMAPALSLAATTSPIDPSYCGPSTTYGYQAFSSDAVYARGDSIYFCLRNNTRIPFFLPETEPWRIIDKHGRLVYQPNSQIITTQPDPTWIFYGTWDGRTNGGRLVPPGKYTIVFNHSSGESVDFTIKPH
jgi:hypothetical protein